MGTGGALKFAEDLLDERFLMLNGDVLTDIDLTAQIAQHERTGATGTLALVPVDDPSNYGLVRLDDDGARARVPREAGARTRAVDVNTISAGAYVLERSVLDLLESGRPASIERDVFPRLVGNGLHGRVDGALLARHRDARPLPAGHLRHPRGRRSPRACPSASTRRARVCRRQRRRGRVVAPAIVEAGCVDRRRARRSAAAPCSAAASRVGARLRRRARRRARRRRRSATTASCAAASIGPDARDRRPHDRRGPRRCSATASRSARGNTITNGARLFPGVRARRRGGAVLDGRARRRRGRGRRLAPARPQRSSTCRSTCATPCGGWSPPGSRRASSAGLVDRRHGRLGRRRAAGGRRDRRPRATADPQRPRLRAARLGSTRTGPSCCRATPAARRRRSRARTRPRRAARTASSTTTGGELAERARADGVPVVPLPGGFQPRAAVGYATVVALEVAAARRRRAVAAGRGRGRGRPRRRSSAASGGPTAPTTRAPKALARELQGRVPVFHGAGLTAPVAYRFKCQVNENANRAAFWSELPEADHNEIEGWRDRSALEPVFLVDPVDTHPRVLERFALTADAIGGGDPARGARRVARRAPHGPRAPRRPRVAVHGGARRHRPRRDPRPAGPQVAAVGATPRWRRPRAPAAAPAAPRR